MCESQSRTVLGAIRDAIIQDDWGEMMRLGELVLRGDRKIRAEFSDNLKSVKGMELE